MSDSLIHCCVCLLLFTQSWIRLTSALPKKHGDPFWSEVIKLRRSGCQHGVRVGGMSLSSETLSPFIPLHLFFSIISPWHGLMCTTRTRIPSRLPSTSLTQVFHRAAMPTKTYLLPGWMQGVIRVEVEPAPRCQKERKERSLCNSGGHDLWVLENRWCGSWMVSGGFLASGRMFFFLTFVEEFCKKKRKKKRKRGPIVVVFCLL